MLIILVLLIALPIVAAIVAMWARARVLRPLATIVALATLVLSIWAVVRVFPGSFSFVFGEMPWLKGLERVGLFGVLMDPLTSLALILITGVGFLVALYSTAYLSEHNRERDLSKGQRLYYFWLLLLIGAMAGVALSPNLLQLFIFWEVTTLCSWALIAYTQEDKTLRAGFKALIMTHIGGLFFLVALFLLFIDTQSFSFTALARLTPALKNLVLLFLLIAAWAKGAQIPFHTWLPDAHAEAVSPVSALLSGVMVKVSVYALARIITTSYVVGPPLAVYLVGLVAAIMALVSMFMALTLYFAQDDLKRLLAYSTIANVGYILLGIGMGMMGSQLAFRGGMLHIITHGFAKTTLFLTAGAVVYATGTRSIRELSGLARKLPLVRLAFATGIMAVSGIPPLACFWSKFYLLAGAFDLSGNLGPIILVLVVVESLISFAWMLRVGQKILLGEPTPVVEAVHDPLPVQMTIVLWLLIVMCIAAPAIGVPLVEHIRYIP
jgi:hydrogenase-4 component D